MPFFSVITVCYNSEKTIERTIQSMLRQSFTDYEYIIVDGNSTDNTLEIVESHRHQFGDRLRVVSEKDNGIYDAMNKGIRMAKGEIVGIVNSDDYYVDNALELIANAYQADHRDSPYKMVYGMIKVIDEAGEFEYVEFESHRLLPRMMIAHPGCFVTRKTYEDLGVFSLDYRIAADYDLMLRIFEDERTVYIPVFEILTIFCRGGASDKYRQTYEETLRVKKAHNCVSKKYYLLEMTKSRIKGIFEKS